MSALTRILDKLIVRNVPKSTCFYSAKTEHQEGKFYDCLFVSKKFFNYL